MEDFNKSHLQNIKIHFKEKTGVELQEPRRSGYPARRVLVMATVLVCMAVLTCYAAAATFDAGALFKLVFSRWQDTPVSDGQGEYIDGHTAAIGESMTQNGVSVTLTGAISDGIMAYLWVDITAPESVALEGHSLGFDVELAPLKAGQENVSISSVSTSCILLQDHDGRENTASMLIRYSVYPLRGGSFSFLDGEKRTLRLKELFYRGEVYPYTLHTIAKGEWLYEFTFAAAQEKEMELLAAPMQMTYSQISGRLVEATIDSIRIRGLSAFVYYTLAPDEVQEAGDVGILKFVMKDGSVIYAHPEKAGQTAQIENGELLVETQGHYCAYAFDAPIRVQDITALNLGNIPVDIVLP